MDKRKVIVVLWLVGMLVPLNWIERLVSSLRRVLWVLTSSEPVHIFGHLILFSGLVVLLLHVYQIPLTRRTAVLMALLVIAIGLGQEYLQLQVKGRAFGWPDLFDLGVDFVAGTLGWVVYRFYQRYGRYLRMAYFILREV